MAWIPFCPEIELLPSLSLSFSLSLSLSLSIYLSISLSLSLSSFRTVKCGLVRLERESRLGFLIASSNSLISSKKNKKMLQQDKHMNLVDFILSKISSIFAIVLP
jgi:hypothetical protein